MNLAATGPKRLAFERRYQLESEPCPRCAGSGVFGSSHNRTTRDCFSCRGLGRKITRAGRDLFKAICKELGSPVIIKESRIDPKHLSQVMGRDVRVGMCVGAIYPVPKPRKLITDLEWLPLDQMRVTFEGPSQAVFSTHDSLSRELTPAELDRVDLLMAAHLDKGAVAADQSGSGGR